MTILLNLAKSIQRYKHIITKLIKLPARFPLFLFHNGLTCAAIVLQKLLCLIDSKPTRLRVLNYLLQGGSLRAMKWDGTQEYPVYVINRAKDTERLRGFSESCRKWGIHFQRVEGVD
jgi:hypothetical protein